MRQEESEPVCIVNGCGRSTLHRIGECARSEPGHEHYMTREAVECGCEPSYSDGAEVQARVDAAMGDALTNIEQDSLIWALHDPDDSCAHNFVPLFHAVTRIVAVRTSAAVKQAQADERERIAQAIEYEACGCVTADGEDDTSDEAFGACKRAVEHAARIARGADL